MPQANKIKHITVKKSPANNSGGHAVRQKAVSITNAHKPSHSKTLMRQAVKKPEPSLKRKVKVYGTVSLSNRSSHSSSVVSSTKLLKHKPPAMPHKVKKSDKIHHFTKAEIEQQLAHSPRPKQLIKAPASTAVQSSFTVPVHSENNHVRTMDEILERVFNKATEHMDPPAKLPKKRNYKFAVAWSVSALLILVAIAGIGYNFDTLKLRAASSKAGFSVNLPSRKPIGYSLSNLSYSTGTVAAVFQNKSNVSYSLVQKTTGWNSRQLENNFVAMNDKNYSVIASSDRTLYLYGSRSATWVNNGVWYLIQSTAGLNDKQLIDMAFSLN